MHFIHVTDHRPYNRSKIGRGCYIRVSQFWSDDKVTVTKQIYFRGTIYYIVPTDEHYMTIASCQSGTEVFRLQGFCSNGYMTKIHFGNRFIFDPRTFGRCTIRKAEYFIHVVRNKYSYCIDCRKPFTDLIPPIVSGRLIRYLR